MVDLFRGAAVAAIFLATAAAAEDFTYPGVAGWHFVASADDTGETGACVVGRNYDDGSSAGFAFSGGPGGAQVAFLYAGERVSDDMVLRIDGAAYAEGAVEADGTYVAVTGGHDDAGPFGDAPGFLRAVGRGTVLSAAGWDFPLDGTAAAFRSLSFRHCMDDLFYLEELHAFGVSDIRPIEDAPPYLAEVATAAPAVTVADGNVLIEGEIGTGFAAAVAAALARTVGDVVIRASPGGYAVEAQDAGRLIRAHDRRVILEGACLSACLDVLAGGVERVVLPTAHIGVHRSWLENETVSFEEAQEIIAENARYYREMGIESDIVFTQLSTPSSEMRLLSRTELQRFNIVTR